MIDAWKVQTKYTSLAGQDPGNLPYSPKQSITDQVRTSITSSLHNLRDSENNDSTETSYVDSLVLHSPLPTPEQTLEAWRAAETFVPTSIKYLGISNVALDQLKELYVSAKIKPSVVQNRFHRDTNYEYELRKFCRDRGIVFQSFWTLTANPGLQNTRPINFLAKAADVEQAVALYCLVLGLKDIIILNGTQTHIQSDLAGLEKVRRWAVENSYDWENTLKHFKDLIGDNNPEPLPLESVPGGIGIHPT